MADMVTNVGQQRGTRPRPLMGRIPVSTKACTLYHSGRTSPPTSVEDNFIITIPTVLRQAAATARLLVVTARMNVGVAPCNHIPTYCHKHILYICTHRAGT
jgi:hypothetical protein